MPAEYLRKVLLTVSANDSDPTATAWFPLNQYAQPFNVSFGVVASGDVDWRVQHTFDDIQDAAITPVAFAHADVCGKEITGQIDGNYAFPVAAVRLQLSSAANAVSGRASGMMWVRQAGL